MRAIETFYKNHLFRSRLEARYAVFFDVVNERWVYEVEGYDLDGDRYLPDFWLPRLECFVEVKGQRPNEREIRVARKLQFHTGYDVIICHGLPNEFEGMWFSWSDDRGGQLVEILGSWAIQDGQLSLTDYPIDNVSEAVRQATVARFENRVPSRAYANIVEYDQVAF